MSVTNEDATRPTGLEPATFGFEVRDSKSPSPDTTKTCETAKEQLTPQLTPKSQKQGKIDTSGLSPDLAEIVAVWLELPEHIKAAIKTLVEAHKGKEFQGTKVTGSQSPD